MPVGNAALGEVVGRELDVDAVAHQDAYAVSAHAARDRGEHDMLALGDLYLEKCVRLFVDALGSVARVIFSRTPY